MQKNVNKIFLCTISWTDTGEFNRELYKYSLNIFLNGKVYKISQYRRNGTFIIVSKSGNPGPGPVPKTRAQIRIFFITSLLRH
jgi:hypothetical protein